MNPSDHNHTARDPLDQDPAEYSEEWLSAYIDDELTDVQRAIVEQRVASDSHAQRLLNELQHMRSLIGQLPSWSGELIDQAGVTQSSLHSESFPETLEQARRTLGEAPQSNLDAQSKPDAQSLLNSPRNLVVPDSPVHAAGDLPRRDVSWWRPIALAACLALLTGGGIWWWQFDSTATLATSARITEPEDELARDDALPAIQFKAAPAAQGVAAQGVAAQEVEAMGVDAQGDMASPSNGAMGGGIGGAMMGRAANAALSEAPGAASEGANMPDSSAEAIVAQSPSAARLQLSPPAQEPMQSFARPSPALRSAETSESRASGSPNGPIEGRGLAKSSVVDLDSLAQPERRRLSGNDRGSAVQVQMAHSAGWSADEVTSVLPRLVPLLNVSPVPPSEAGNAEQGDIGRAAEIPIALIAQRPVAEKSIPLMDVLGQQSVALQQVAASDAQSYSRHMPLEQALAFGGIASKDKTAGDHAPGESAPGESAPGESATRESPTAESAIAESATIAADKAERPFSKREANSQNSSSADARQAAPTVALFVLREEAEQILKAARQAGEILANPVWITSASGNTTPVGPKQQVVLLFTPQ